MTAPRLLVMLLLLTALSLPARAATTYEVQLIVSKYVFGPGENISLSGSVRSIASNTTSNVTSFVANANATLAIINASNGTVASYNFTTDENGTFVSRNSFYPGAQAVAAPVQPGTYTVRAAVDTWEARASLVVVGSRVDDIVFQLPKVNFYAAERIPVTAKAVQRVGDSFAGVGNVSLNITLRYANESALSAFSCITDAAGSCGANVTAPSSLGVYILEANSFVGFTNVYVVPFDAETYMKDSTALAFKNMFVRGESGFVEVRVSYNGTSPSGSYNASARVMDSTGAEVLNLSSVILNETNGFVDKIPFTATSGLRIGSYSVLVTVRQGTVAVNVTTMFQVRDWLLTVTKASQNSGFEYGYTAFGRALARFEAYPTERTNGTVIAGLADNFTIVLRDGIGSAVANATTRYNATCGAKPCYEFNITLPATAGTYALSVGLNYSGDYQVVDRAMQVTGITAFAQPSDSEGTIKELFGTTEYVYLTLSARTNTSTINVTQAEIASITYENGTQLAYGETNASAMNLSDSVLRWAWNSSAGRIVLDPPRKGGVYLAELYVSNRSAVVTTRFGINPYDICASAKGSADTSTSDYWYQFRTSDTVYFHLKVNEAQNSAGKTLAGSNLSGFSPEYGRSAACSFDATRKRAVNNATIRIDSVVNMRSGKQETLNTSSSTCTAVDSSGGYVCTVQAADGTWDGGRHAVTFTVIGEDHETSNKGSGFFEARAFYIYGYSPNWANRASANITLTINAYEAGSGWWSSQSGLSGTAVVDSVSYYGGAGEWIWPPIKYNYNATGLNITITNGIGSATLGPERTPSGRWQGGYYAAVIRATINDQVDYGEAWFSIRSWDVYATPVEIRGSAFEQKSSVNTKQNASLYVRITEAGDWSDYSGGRALGTVAIRVKKILDYSQWPARELSSGNFTATSITVNATSPWYSSATVASHSGYLINISPAAGSWEPGYYSVIFDLNNTETGYGWFNAISFYVNTFPTDANGSRYVYNNKGIAVYINVTATKSQKSTYVASDFVNTTIADIVVRSWDPVAQAQREFKYPDAINLTPLLINGSGVINISYRAGNWPSGYYWGELKLREAAENTTSKGYLWFNVQPFRISSSMSSYTIGTRENATMAISVYEPDYYANTLLNGNYTVSGVQESSWSGGLYQIASLNYTTANGSTFRNATSLIVYPPGGKWSAGYKSGSIVIRDTLTNDTQNAWFWFRASPFTDTVNRMSDANVGPYTNVTANITLSSPSGGTAYGNLSSAFYWGWPSKTRYRFAIGSCDSQAQRSCLINRSATVTIMPPSDGWHEGYNYVYFEYQDADDGNPVDSYNGIYFYVRQPITGYMYAVGPNGYWQNSFGQSENVTMYLYSLQNLSGASLSVNVTAVQVAKTASGCWTDSCRSYGNRSFEVMRLVNGTLLGSGGANMTASGYLRINASGGAWELGDYAVKIVVQRGSETGIIKDATFRVIDRNGPVIAITSPAAEQAINASSILFTATTSEQAVCYLSLYNYNQFDQYYCSYNGSTPAGCNATRYNFSSIAYYASASKWWSTAGNLLYTDSTSHSYNHPTAGMPVPQNYTVKLDCYDSDWNSASNATTFSLIGGAGTTNATNASSSNPTARVTIGAPQNTTYNATNVTLTYYPANFTPAACWYRLDAASAVQLGCRNATFIAAEGTHTLAVYANASNGTAVNASVSFAVDVSGPEITVVSPTPANASIVNANSIVVNVTVSEALSLVRLEFNGTNYTMINASLTGLVWYRNHTNITYGNHTYRIHALDAYGNSNATLLRYLTINVTS